jgi:hypothetical protein
MMIIIIIIIVIIIIIIIIGSIQNFLHTLSAERSDAAATRPRSGRPPAGGWSDYYIIIAIIIAIV